MQSRIRIELFAGLGMSLGAHELPPLRSQKAASLLAFLAYYPDRRHAREVLIEMLWPDADPEAGRNRLNVCLSQIRSHFKSSRAGDGVLQSDRLGVWLDRARIETDVAAFESHLAAAADAGCASRIDHLAASVDLYRGPLLPGFYENWIPPQQERLRESVNRASAELIRLLGEQDKDRAIEYARRITHAEPLLESAQRDLMRLLAQAGRPAEALLQYRLLERKLRDDLGVSPSEETHRLIEEISRERAPATRAANGTAAAAPVPEARDEAQPRSQPDARPEARDFPVLRPQGRSLRWTVALAALLTLVVVVLRFPHRVPHRAAAPPRLAAPGQPRLLWTSAYTPAADEKDSEATALASDAAGNIYVAGFVQTSGHDNDILTMKFSPNGKLVWRKRWNNPKTNDCDRGRFIAADRWGNVWVTGETYNGDREKGGSQWDVVTLKYDVNGNLKWARVFNSRPNDDDTPAGLGRDRDGSVYVAGTAKRPDGSEHFFLVKYDTDGNRLWTEEPGPAIESLPITDIAVRSVVVDEAGLGELFLTGSATFQDSATQRSRSLFTLRYGRDRHREWQSRFTSKLIAPTEGRAMAVDAELNTYVVSAYSLPNGNEAGEDMVVVKYDPSGNEVWSTPCRQGPMGAYVTPRDLKVDKAGNVFALATVGYASHALQESDVFAFGPTGQPLWSNRSDKVGAVGLVPCGDAGAAYWGSVEGGGPLDFPDRFRMVCLDAQGDRRSTHEIKAAPGRYVKASVLQQDSHGDLIAAGQFWSGKHPSIVLYKYSP